jgi:hypothetical protein
MKLFLLILATLTLSAHAQYKHKDGVFGLINQSEYEESGVDYEKDFGFGLGWTRYYEKERGAFRTGLGIVSRNSKDKSTKAQEDVQYLEIPFTLLVKTSDSFGFFGGVNLNMKFMSTVADDYERFLLTFILGGHIKAGEKSAFEPYMEFGMQDVAEDQELKNSFGIKYVYFY